jgi:hypothetical protein
MSRACIIAVSLAAATLAVSGCGGGSGTTSSSSGGGSSGSGAANSNGSEKILNVAELAIKADAACARVNADLKAMNIRTRQEYGTVLPRVAAQEQAAFTELSQLKPPASVAAGWRQLVTGGQTLASNTSRIGAAVTSHNGSLSRALLLSASKADQSIGAAARRYGWTACAKLA